MQDHSITQKEVAKALGLAQSTVSMALRDHPSIPEDRREEIKTAAAAMGYRPNPTAAALAHLRQASKVQPIHASVAWLNGWSEPEKLRSYRAFEQYWQGASGAAAKLGYRLEEFVVNASIPMARTEQILKARGVNGILLPPGPLPAGWEQFDWNEFAVVRLSRSASENDLPARTVIGNQLGNTMLALTRMRELGYERVGFVGIDWKERLFGAGYLWSQRGVAGAEELPPLFLSEEDRPNWQGLFEEWLERVRPDAILTEIGSVPGMLEAAGYHLPGEMGVASLSVMDGPVDAGVDQNSYEVGYTAMMTLAALIQTRDFGIPGVHRQTLIDGSWVDGSSLPDRRCASKEGLAGGALGVAR
jgi:DNA-binding LacI/PurR family transcriptional regulator